MTSLLGSSMGILAAISIAFSAPVAAQAPSLTDADRRDVACIMALGATAEQIAEKQKIPVEAVQASAAYFFGKIKGRHPELILAKALTRDVVSSFKADDWGSTLRRCGTELQDVGADMEASGKSLSVAGKD